MAIYAQKKSILLINGVFRFFGHFEFKYQKVREVQSCTKFYLQTFFTYVKKKLLHKNLRYDMMLISALFLFLISHGMSNQTPRRGKNSKKYKCKIQARYHISVFTFSFFQIFLFMGV